MRNATLRAITPALLVLALASAACDRAPAAALPRGARVRLYKGSLNFPIDMAWARGTKRVFFTEKNTGRIRVLVGRRLLARPCVDLAVDSAGERGALGIALDPRFRRNHRLYVYYTNAAPLENRVTRFTVERNRCVRPRTIVRGLSASSSGYHNGGQLEFVKGRLFVSTGEAHDAARAQSLRRRAGKILRVRPDGSVPTSNPFRRRGRPSPVWSYGHRNPFGLAHKPGSARLFETENGPNCDDELNRIRRGRNYGWGPGYACGTRGVGPRPKAPLVRWSSVIVPTDPTWYNGRLKSLAGSIYVGDFATHKLRRFVLGPRGERVRARRVVLTAPGPIVDVATGPGGWLYFVTTSAIYRIVR